MNPNELLISSDYPMDQVVYLSSGSFTVPSGSSTPIDVLHFLVFRPLAVGTWSLDPDFIVSYEQGSSGFTSLSVPQLTIQSTLSTIRFVPLNNTGSSVTFYWRVFGFMPSDFNESANPTASQADTLALSSDYNNCKVWRAGMLNWASGTQAIEHNFGYRPQIEVWYEEPLNADYLTKWSQGLDNSFTAFNRVLMNENQVIFRFGDPSGVNGRKWYYRIYTDSGVPT